MTLAEYYKSLPKELKQTEAAAFIVILATDGAPTVAASTAPSNVRELLRMLLVAGQWPAESLQ